jgi:uncharacterized protein YvpB
VRANGFGVSGHRSQAELAHSLGVRLDSGVPHSRITRLRSSQVNIIHQTAQGLNDLGVYLNHDLPVIAFVQAKELPHWRGRWSQHAVVIVGIDQDNVYLLDPAAQSSVITVTHDDFLLAWDEMKFSYAVISKRS